VFIVIALLISLQGGSTYAKYVNISVSVSVSVSVSALNLNPKSPSHARFRNLSFLLLFAKFFKNLKAEKRAAVDRDV
jgi:hypothetical protein